MWIGNNTLRNLTGSPLTLLMSGQWVTIPADNFVADLKLKKECYGVDHELTEVDGKHVDVTNATFFPCNDDCNLPFDEVRVILIVSKLVALVTCHYRDTVVFPDDPVTDETGKIIGYKTLIAPSLPILPVRE